MVLDITVDLVDVALVVNQHVSEPLMTSLDMVMPESRPIESRPSWGAKIARLPRVGGLHHRYAWQEAA